MSTHKHIDKICCIVLALALVLTVLFVNAESLGVQKTSTVMGYESTLFDTSKVHTIDIVMDDWDTFTANCKSEEYSACSLVIDGEAYKNVAIRGKGNTSLSQVTNGRYSYKIEFDHYDSSTTYHGLDKLCLNNIIQDNTYMKDYLSYEMMRAAGAAAPLCSYVYLTVNGEDWGLYLAVEGVEESFLQRNFGSNYGDLYKPDSTDMGGGRGNGQNFGEDAQPTGGLGGSESRSDVLLQYIDDDPDSYPNIFGNAKTDCTAADKTRLIAALQALGGENAADAVDAESVIRYFVAHNFVLNFDSYTGSMIHNYYLYEQDGKLQMLPWDYNLAFGGFQSGSDATSLVNYPIDTPVSGGSVADRPMLAWILESQEYTALYHEYFSEFLSEYFDSGYFAGMMDSVKAMIAPYVEKDPTKFCTYEEFETGIDTLKSFCLLRAESIRGQLDGAIGSTADTQTADTLIDADNLTVSAMGSMGGGGQPGGMSVPTNRGDTVGGNQPSDRNGSGKSTPPPNFSGETPTDMPDTMPGGAPPDRPNANSDSSAESPPLPEDTPPDRPDESTDNMKKSTPPDRPDNGSDTAPDSSFGRQQPDLPGAESGTAAQTQTLSSSLPLMAVSIAALAAGLAFALLYKHRK